MRFDKVMLLKQNNLLQTIGIHSAKRTIITPNHSTAKFYSVFANPDQLNCVRLGNLTK